MADFLDFDALEMTADEQVNGAKEHPLKGMKAGAKMAYVGGLLFACHADDNALQREERSLVTGVARSLGLGKEEVDDLVEMVSGLTDKIAYLREIVAALKDRGTILFFICDMIKAMGADGEINDNAQKLIGAVEKLAHLEESDKVLVKSYQKILSGCVSEEVSALSFGDIASEGVDKSLLEWFAPQMVQKCEDALTKSASEKPLVEARLPFSQALEEALKKFESNATTGLFRNVRGGLFTLDYFSYLYIGRIPADSYAEAHECMCVREEDHFLQYTEINRIPRFEDSGIVFTGAALYHKGRRAGGDWRAEWSYFADCDEAWMEGTNIYIGNGRKGKALCLDVYSMSDSTRGAFCELMNDILNAIKSGKYEFGR